ncbi:MAG: TetR/AcrR family transcriptional regulator [Pseudomonadota bacterium]
MEHELKDLPHDPAAVRGITAANGSTKARLERAAIQLFVQKGVDATTTREIAFEAGVAEGTLYRHFKSKDELAEGAFFFVHSHLAAIIQKTGANNSSLSDQISGVVSAICDFADDDWDLFRFHLLFTHHYLPRRHDDDNPVTAVEQLIRMAIKDGLILASPEEETVRLMSAMALGPILQTALHIAYGRLIGPMSAYKSSLTDGVHRVLSAHQSQGAPL